MAGFGIYILLSIKTRIETRIPDFIGNITRSIYILLSIKTRIETAHWRMERARLSHQFISYYPLKQGLKQEQIAALTAETKAFISYYPLKQGLKH